MKTLLLSLLLASSVMAQNNRFELAEMVSKKMVNVPVYVTLVTNKPMIQLWQDQGILVVTTDYMEKHVISSYEIMGKVYPPQTNFYFPVTYSVTNQIPGVTPSKTNAVPIRLNTRFRPVDPPTPLPTNQ